MMIRGQFTDFFFETALPALDSIFWDRFRKKKRLMPMLFKVEESTTSIEQRSQMSGVGLFQEIPETGEVAIDQPLQGFDSLFRHRRYGLGVEYSRDLYEDDKWGIIKAMPGELADSAAETREIQGASHFNNGFSGSYNGPDGVPLFSASHPLYKKGGVQSNILSVAGDLSVTSLEIALTDWETQVRSNGHPISLPTPKLLCAPANRWNAHEILKGEHRSDTANRTINAFQYGETGPVESIMVWNRLTDADAWFLVAPPGVNGLVWFDRVKVYTRGFSDDRNERAGLASRYRASSGWHNYLGVYGTPGA